jgi:hypothetical protein
VYQDLYLRDRSGKHGVLFTDKDIALPDINGNHGVPLPDKSDQPRQYRTVLHLTGVVDKHIRGLLHTSAVTGVSTLLKNLQTT